jgi:hypothetical protein
MFGFYYAVLGLIFGILCSVKAKDMKISNTEWFTLGFAFNIPAYLALFVYASRTDSSKQIDFHSGKAVSGITYEV